MSATVRNGAQQLDPRQLLAADRLAAGATDRQVADQLGVDRTSLWRWRQQPAFQTELARRREEVWNDAADLRTKLEARIRGTVPIPVR